MIGRSPPKPIRHENRIPVFSWRDEDAVLELAAAKQIGTFIIEGAPTTEPAPSLEKFLSACLRRTAR